MSGERRRAIEARVAAAAARLEKEGHYTATRRCIQHGKVSVYAHCVSVADTACVLAETLHLRVNERALIRGALLHDYFLYDWHDKANGHHWHGFTHPGTALHNASEDWKLTPVSVGQNVSQGDVIGHVGTTGNSTGNHLHLELRVNGARTNPLNYVPH